MKSFVRKVYMLAGPRTAPLPKGSPNCPRTPVLGDRTHICIGNSFLARNTNNPGKTVPNGFEDSQILEDFLSLPQVVLVANQEYALLQRKVCRQRLNYWLLYLLLRAYWIVVAEVASVGEPEPAVVDLGSVAPRRHVEALGRPFLRSYLEALPHLAIRDLHVLSDLKWGGQDIKD